MLLVADCKVRDSLRSSSSLSLALVHFDYAGLNEETEHHLGVAHLPNQHVSVLLYLRRQHTLQHHILHVHAHTLLEAFFVFQRALADGVWQLLRVSPFKD